MGTARNWLGWGRNGKLDLYGKLLLKPNVHPRERARVHVVAPIPFGTKSPQANAIAREAASSIDRYKPEFVFYMGGWQDPEGVIEADEMQERVEAELRHLGYPLEGLQVIKERETMDTHQQVVFMGGTIERLMREGKLARVPTPGVHVVAEELHFGRVISHCLRLIMDANVSGTQSHAKDWDNAKAILRTRNGFARREVIVARLYWLGLASVLSKFSKP